MVTATTAPDDSTELSIDYTYDLNGLRTGKTVTTRTYSTHTHNYTTTVVAPTCTTGGYTLHECACGDSYQDSTVSKLGHAYRQVRQSGGTITYRCTRCGHIYYSSEIIIPPQPPTDPPVIASLGDDENAEAAPLTETETGETDSLGEAGNEPSATATGSGDGRSLISTVTEHHDYIYASGQLLRETITTTAADGTVTVEVLDFAYDNAGTPYALTYTNGTTSTTYYYITNLQGDVMYLGDANGDTAAEYAYDAYGNITAASGSMAEINPLRYRGYYYDKESGFYYLQSRYYNPIVKRFLNADALASTGQGFIGHNMFSYCLNNPVNAIDPDGEVSIWYFLIQSCRMGLVHATVQLDIVANYTGIEIEKWVNDSEEVCVGRADVINQAGHVWEVKHAGKFPALRAEIAQIQAIRYLNKTCADSGRRVSSLGAAGTFSGTFTLSIGENYYSVSYWTPRDGAILYSVVEISKPDTVVDYAYCMNENKKIVRQTACEGLPSGLGNGGLVPIPVIPIWIPSGGGKIGDPVFSSCFY